MFKNFSKILMFLLFFVFLTVSTVQKKLQLEGVGYRAEKKGKTLVMNLGYSHPVEMEDPEGITSK